MRAESIGRLREAGISEMVYSGGCHCGDVLIECRGSIDQVVDCDCSQCILHGFLWWFRPADDFRLLAGNTCLTRYTFHTGTIHHYFCKRCGTTPFAINTNLDGRVAVNARCLLDVDVESLDRVTYEGSRLL